jgi:hypothetical protein
MELKDFHHAAVKHHAIPGVFGAHPEVQRHATHVHSTLLHRRDVQRGT